MRGDQKRKAFNPSQHVPDRSFRNRNLKNFFSLSLKSASSGKVLALDIRNEGFKPRQCTVDQNGFRVARARVLSLWKNSRTNGRFLELVCYALYVVIFSLDWGPTNDILRSS